MISKIVSFVSLIVSIAAFLVSGAFFVYRVDSDLSLFPVVLLICSTFVMTIICAFNYYHTIMSPQDDSDTDENSESDKQSQAD